MLDLKPFQREIEDIEPGQTVRLNHTDCEAGEDTRRRLYLTRTHADETKVIGYCHNCQQGGITGDKNYKQYRHDKHTKPSNDKVEIGETITEPNGLIPHWGHWPANAQAWAIKRKLNQEDINWYGIQYDPSTDRIYLPRWEEMDRCSNSHPYSLAGYQLRSLTGYSRPKYLTAQRMDAKNYTFIKPAQAHCDYVVIVEDLVSAIHIIRATEDDENAGNLPGVYVNYGTKVDPTLMYNIANTYKWAAVWLDNDNQHVDNQSKIMARTIAMYSDAIRVRRVENFNDPKYYEPYEIREILDEVWKDG